MHLAPSWHWARRLLAASILWGAALSAQAQTAPAAATAGSSFLEGHLLQPKGGGPLAGIVVTIVETGATAAVDEHGYFAFSSVPPGAYTLIASGKGYAPLKITDVIVPAGGSPALQAETMPLGETEQTVSAGRAGSAQNVQTLAEFYVTEAPVRPFENGANLDIPRTSDDVQPYTIINGEALEESNRTTLGDFLQDELSQNTTGLQFSEQIANYGGTLNASGASQINLRGLGTLQTLILVNGVRIPSAANKSAVGQQNINQFPLSAIDHIEVLPSSASGIYGSSAIGGVINIVLKKNYSGGEIVATYQNTVDTDSPSRSVDATYGFAVGSKTHVMIMAHYDDGKPPVWQDRTFDIDYYERVLARDPALLYTNAVPYSAGSTPNIALDTAAVNGFTNPAGSTNLVLKNGVSLGSPITYVPAGTSPSTIAATLDSGLIADAGQYNLGLAPSVYRGLYTPMLVTPMHDSVAVSIDHDFTPNLEAYANFGIYHSQAVQNYISLINGQLTTNALNVAVPGNAPDNPFEQNVLVSLPLPQNQATRLTNYWETRNLTAGLIGHLPGDWESTLVYSWGGNYVSNVYGLDDFLTTTTFGGDAPALYNGAYNPFVDTVAYPQNMAGYYGTYRQVQNATLGDFNLRASGPVYHLPAGRPNLTLGVEARADATDPFQASGTFPPYPGGPNPNPTDAIPNTILGEKELTQAVYSEIEIPVVSPKNQIPLLNDLELQAAGRIEKFSVISDPGSIVYYPYSPSQDTDAQHQRAWNRFQSANPTYGIKYKPFPSVTLRASYATAFVPPTYAQLGGTVSTVSTAMTATTFDPKTGQTYAVPENSGILANPDLRPQTSRSWDIGGIWEPNLDLLKGLRIDLEFYKIFEYNLIYNPGYAQVLNIPSLSYLVPRDPSTGLVTSFTDEYINLSQQYTSGWDLSFDYSKQTPIGRFNLHASGTVIEHIKQPEQIGGPLLEYDGFADDGGAIKTKVNGTLTWLIGQHWTLGWTTIYYDSYKVADSPGDPIYNGTTAETLINTDFLPQGSYSVPSQVYHNVFGSYRFGANSWHHIMDGVTIQVGLNDVFNTAPPFDAYSGFAPFFYSPYGSILLRTYTLKVKKEF